MKRFVPLAVALVAVFLFGCGKVENITKEEYLFVKKKIADSYDFLSLAGLSIQGGITYESHRGFHLSIPITRGYGRTLARAALNHKRACIEALFAAKRACFLNKNKIDFRSFNLAHERYGRLGMTYTKELRELDSVLTLLEPQVRKFFLKRVSRSISVIMTTRNIFILKKLSHTDWIQKSSNALHGLHTIWVSAMSRCSSRSKKMVGFLSTAAPIQ